MADEKEPLPAESPDIHERIVGRNPFPADDPRRKLLSDISMGLAENIVQARAEMVRKLIKTPQQAPATIALDLLETYFDIHAEAFVVFIGPSTRTGWYDDLLRITQEYLLDWGRRTVRFPVSEIQNRFERDLQLRLAQRYSHWLAAALKAARAADAQSGTEKERQRASPAPPAAEKASPAEPTLAESRHASVDEFLEKVGTHAGRRITRTDIWMVAGYTEKTEFHRYQRGEGTRGSVAKFERVLRMSPPDFMERLTKLTRKK